MIKRDRMTERVTPSLLKIELKRSTRPLILLAMGFGCALLAGKYILTHINGGVGGTHTIKVHVADATGVVPERAEIRFEGIQAGLVQQVDLINGRAVLTASVANKYGPVYRNARIAVRPNTALQDMYLDIVNPGTPSAGVAGPGYVIPPNQTTSPVNAAEVLNVFEPNVRAHLYNVLDELGNGLQDRGAMLRRAFADLAPLLSVAQRVSQQLAVRADYTEQLVRNAGSLSSVLADRSSQLRNLVLAGTKTLDALSTRGGAPLKDTLRALPPTLAAIPRATQAVDVLLTHLNPAITSLYSTATRLGPALNDLRSFAHSALPAVTALREPVRRLVPLSEQLRPFAAALASSLKFIKPQTGYVKNIVDKVAACPDVLYAFFNWTASVFKFLDPYGVYARADFALGLYTPPNGKNPPDIIQQPNCAGGTTIEGVPTTYAPGPPLQLLKAAFP
jgi:ABC-type transporter Mla subunit MlaD